MTLRAARLEPFYLQGRAGALYCQYVLPAGQVRGGVLFIHPFAEEMNKSRRMVMQQARALALLGWCVLMPDLTGCGDSCGDFGDATWSDWCADVATARAWLAHQTGQPLWLWGLRAGALLAGGSLARAPEGVAGLLLWQPVLSGRQQLQQFLRLKSGADWLAGPSAAASGEAAKSQQPGPMQLLESGQHVEVAGYRVHPRLAAGLAQASLPLPPAACRLACFEVAPRAQPEITPATRRWLGAGPPRPQDTVIAVQGPSFWQTQEVELAPGLLVSTTGVFAA